MLTCNCVVSEQFTNYFTRLQYGLSPDKCNDYIRKVKIAQLLIYMESISNDTCSEDMRCLYEELNCSA